MAAYTGTVILSGMISPTDTTDQYPTHEDTLGKGGYRSVSTISERDAISDLRRKIGMLVFCEEDSKFYYLNGGITNSDWNEFSNASDGTTDELIQTTIAVSGIINGIFSGIQIPSGEILYIRGNDSELDPTVYSGSLTTVLVNNKYNDFIITFDGTSSTVYVNNNVDENHVQLAINKYPKGYDIIDLTTYSIPQNIKDLLVNNYTSNIITFSSQGLVSMIDIEDNTFVALNKDKDYVVSYDGSSFYAYKKINITIQNLQDRMVLI